MLQAAIHSYPHVAFWVQLVVFLWLEFGLLVSLALSKTWNRPNRPTILNPKDNNSVTPASIFTNTCARNGFLSIGFALVAPVAYLVLTKDVYSVSRWPYLIAYFVLYSLWLLGPIGVWVSTIANVLLASSFSWGPLPLSYDLFDESFTMLGIGVYVFVCIWSLRVSLRAAMADYARRFRTGMQTREMSASKSTVDPSLWIPFWHLASVGLFFAIVAVLVFNLA